MSRTRHKSSSESLIRKLLNDNSNLRFSPSLRYSSDMMDREWELVAAFIPPAKRGGLRWTTDMREVINAILSIAASGGAWRMLPKCFPPVSTVRLYFYAWRAWDCSMRSIQCW